MVRAMPGLIVSPVSTVSRRRFLATLWAVVAVALCAAPLVVEWLSPARLGGFIWVFGVALGSAGFALGGLQFLLTGRFRRATAPFGIDLVYLVHRWAAVAALLLLCAHAGILWINNPAAVGGARPWTASGAILAGWISLALFLLLVVSALARRALRWEYDGWRRAHAALALVATGAGLFHVVGVVAPQGRVVAIVVWLGLGALWLGSLFHVRLLRPWALARHPYAVTAVERVGARTWTVRVAASRGEAIRFRPGQFAWLTLRAGPFAGAEHPFSFSGSAEARSELSFTIKELGDFTGTIGSVRVGELAYVDGPYGAFTPDRHPEASGWVLIAGGVGLAPMMSILRTFADRGERRPVLLVCAHRTDASRLFVAELQALERRLSLTVVPVLEEPPAGWAGECGRVTVDLLRRVWPADATGRECFLCGPMPMTRAVSRALREIGVSGRNIHVELFDMA
jgi:predicted ferric reductase